MQTSPSGLTPQQTYALLTVSSCMMLAPVAIAMEISGAGSSRLAAAHLTPSFSGFRLAALLVFTGFVQYLSNEIAFCVSLSPECLHQLALEHCRRRHRLMHPLVDTVHHYECEHEIILRKCTRLTIGMRLPNTTDALSNPARHVCCGQHAQAFHRSGRLAHLFPSSARIDGRHQTKQFALASDLYTLACHSFSHSRLGSFLILCIPYITCILCIPRVPYSVYPIHPYISCICLMYTSKAAFHVSHISYVACLQLRKDRNPATHFTQIQLQPVLQCCPLTRKRATS